MANIKTLGIVLLVGALTTYLIIRHNGHIHKPDPKTLNATNNRFSSWKSRHNFKFGAAEDKFRSNLFSKHAKFIDEHNAKPNKSFELATNGFAGYTDEEFSALFTGELRDAPTAPSKVERLDTADLDSLTLTTVDWTNQGAVTPVKNQGHCGSCWTFSATGALEGLYFVQNKALKSFSEQQLVDCASTPEYNNDGCDGGLALNAFRYVFEKGGIVEEAAYPYKAVQGNCSIPESAPRFKTNNYTHIPIGDIVQMQAALSKQPIAVSVKADAQVFRFYKGGILDSDECGTDLNHAVLATGFDAGKYWRVKNSWGPEWGVDGYILIAMRANGTPGVCGVHKRPTFPNPAL